MQSEPAQTARRASLLRRDHQPQNYSKPVRAAQFSPSPIRKSSATSRGAASTSSTKPTTTISAERIAVIQQAGLPIAVPQPPKKASRAPNSRSVSPKAADEDKENQCSTYSVPTLPAAPMKATPAAHQTAAQKEAGVNLSSQIPHSSLEVDDMGLFTLKPRATQDIASIDPKDKVTRSFCQPVARSSVIPRGEQAFLSTQVEQHQGKQEFVALSQQSESQNTWNATTVASIADRRNLKLDSKAKQSSGLARAQKIQLPNIKDTSEGDPSVLSDARAVSDIVSIDFEQAGRQCEDQRSKNLQRLPSDSQKNLLPVSGMETPGLARQSTCLIEPSNYFGSSAQNAVSAKASQGSSSKKKAKEGSLHGRWTDQEHRLFLEGMHLFKKDWRSIERHIGTRTCSQIRSHAQKYFMRLEKQQSGNHEGPNLMNSSKASLNNGSLDGSESHPLDQLANPYIAKMLGSASIAENQSGSKKASLSNLKPDICQLEQELSQSQTLGYTPSHQNRTPPPYRSSAKRRKVSDDPLFKSHEKTMQLPTAKAKLDSGSSAMKTPSKKIFKEDELRSLALQAELSNLRAQRNQLCANFVKKSCSIPDFCIQLDCIGKKFADNCLFANIYNLNEYAQKYDTETLLTRMLLKGMIEYLSSTVQPSALQAAMIQLSGVQFSAQDEGAAGTTAPIETKKV